MLLFRSGSRFFRGARLSLVFLVVGSCLAFAGDRKHRRSAASPSPSAAKDGVDLKDIPLTVGHEAKGLVLPNYDLQGNLLGRFEAGTAARLDDNHVKFTDLKIVSYDAKEKPDFDVVMQEWRNRFARHAHADLHFGTDADPFDMRRERLEQRRVALVAAVEPHLVAKQARRDADPNCLHPFSPGGFAPSASARTRATAGSGETSPKPNGEGGPDPPARSLAGTPGPAPFAWLARCARSLMRVPGTS